MNDVGDGGFKARKMGRDSGIRYKTRSVEKSNLVYVAVTFTNYLQTCYFSPNSNSFQLSNASRTWTPGPPATSATLPSIVQIPSTRRHSPDRRRPRHDLLKVLPEEPPLPIQVSEYNVGMD